MVYKLRLPVMARYLSDVITRFFVVLGWLLLAVFGGVAIAATPTEFEMPFGLTMAPDTRIVDVAQYFVGEVQEANGSLATKGSAKDAINFYEKALKDAGFRIFSKTNQDGRIGFAGKRSKGDYFSLSSSSRSYMEVEAGEIELRVVIRYAP